MQCGPVIQKNNFNDTAQKTGQAGSNEATSDWTKADFLCKVLKKSREDAASNCSNIWSRCRGCTRWPAISDGSVETNKRPPYFVETLPTQGITWPEHRHQAECLLIRHFDIQPLRCYSNYKLKEYTAITFRGRFSYNSLKLLYVTFDRGRMVWALWPPTKGEFLRWKRPASVWLIAPIAL